MDHKEFQKQIDSCDIPIEDILQEHLRTPYRHKVFPFEEMSHKQFLQILVQSGKMWSWPYLRECVDTYSEQECENWHKTIIEKWLVFYKERWEELLNIASRDEIETIWRECIKPQGRYFQYANEYLIFAVQK